MSKYIFLYVVETNTEFALRCLGFHDGETRQEALENLLDLLEKQNFYNRVEQWELAEQRLAYRVDGEWEVDKHGNENPEQRS